MKCVRPAFNPALELGELIDLWIPRGDFLVLERGGWPFHVCLPGINLLAPRRAP
jgi:hypothetical protein